MYKVIGATKSRAMRVMWMLEELGQPYDHVPCGPRSDEAKQYNPSGKIPAKHSFVFPQEQRVPEIKDSLKAEFARSAAILSDRLDGPFLMGEEVTIPDLLATHCINWSIGAGFARVDDKLGNWAKSMRDRPAFKAAATREG